MTDLYVTPFNCRPKPKICRLKPVICRPAQEHSGHQPVMDCRPETPCVVTDIPKRDNILSNFLCFIFYFAHLGAVSNTFNDNGQSRILSK